MQPISVETSACNIHVDDTGDHILHLYPTILARIEDTPGSLAPRHGSSLFPIDLAQPKMKNIHLLKRIGVYNRHPYTRVKLLPDL